VIDPPDGSSATSPPPGSHPARGVASPGTSPLTPHATDVDAIRALADSVCAELTTPPHPIVGGAAATPADAALGAGVAGGAGSDLDDVCPLCHSWCPLQLPLCDSCLVTGAQVDFPVGPASVITLVTKPSLLRDWMTRYKGRAGDADDPYDPEALAIVRAIAGRYLLEHGEALAAAVGPVDAIVVPPSAGGRPPPHPLETVLGSLSLGVPVVPLLARGPGELNFRVASRDGFVVRPAAGVSGGLDAYSRTSDDDSGAGRLRVLLVDDVFVTGARLFSAARAVLDGGHEVAGMLALARRINLSFGDCEQLWERQRAFPFDWNSSPLTMAMDEGLLAFARTVPPPNDAGPGEASNGDGYSEADHDGGLNVVDVQAERDRSV
jgi:hypothetical protein